MQALWTNMSAFPPMILRIIMIAAVFIPMYFKRELTIFGFPFFLVLRGQWATSYQYLPDSNSFIFYFPLLLSLVLVHWKTLQPINIKSYILLIILTLYMSIIDLLGNAEFGNYTHNLVLVIIFSLFITNKYDFDIFSASLLSICTFSAIYYLVMHNQFLITLNSVEDIERSGWKDPNYFATFMNVGFMISLFYLHAYLISSLLFFNKLILIISCLVISMGVVLTASRAGFFCLAFILIITILWSKPNVKTLLIGLTIIAAAIIIMYSQGFFDTLLYRIFEQGNLDTGGDRTNIWRTAINNFGLQPYPLQLFGGGYWHRITLTGGYDTHNEFIAILIDYGIIGLAIFLSFIISLFSFFSSVHSNIRNIASTLYILCIVSLSPFQYVNIGFLIIWILSIKKFDSNFLYSYENSSIYSSVPFK